MSTCYYLDEKGDTLSCEEGDLKRLAGVGIIKPETQVCLEGEAAWRAAASVKGLFAQAKAAVPVAPVVVTKPPPLPSKSKTAGKRIPCKDPVIASVLRVCGALVGVFGLIGSLAAGADAGGVVFFAALFATVVSSVCMLGFGEVISLLALIHHEACLSRLFMDGGMK